MDNGSWQGQGNGNPMPQAQPWQASQYPQQQMPQQQAQYPSRQQAAPQYRSHPQQYPQQPQYPQYPQYPQPQQPRRMPAWLIAVLAVLGVAIVAAIALVLLKDPFGNPRGDDPETQGETPATTTDDTDDPSDATTSPSTRSQDDPLSFVDSDEVTEYDLQLARDSGAPDDVIASLEAGRWPSEDDKVFVRRTNLAIAYMLSQYGEECYPNGTYYGPSQGLLFSKETTIVLLTITSGSNKGAVVEVHVSIDGDKVLCYDSYGEVVASSGDKQAYDAAIQAAMAGIPENSWTVEMNAQYGIYFARVFIAPGVVNDQASLDSLVAKMDEECQKAGIPGKNEAIVLPTAPADRVMTMDYVDATWGQDHQELMSSGSTI